MAILRWFCLGMLAASRWSFCVRKMHKSFGCRKEADLLLCSGPFFSFHMETWHQHIYIEVDRNLNFDLVFRFLFVNRVVGGCVCVRVWEKLCEMGTWCGSDCSTGPTHDWAEVVCDRVCAGAWLTLNGMALHGNRTGRIGHTRWLLVSLGAHSQNAHAQYWNSEK